MSSALSDSVDDISVWVPCSSQILHHLHCTIPGLYFNYVISPGIAAVSHVQSVLNSEFCSPLTHLDHSWLSAEREFASVPVADLWRLSEEGLHEIHRGLALFLEVPAEMRQRRQLMRQQRQLMRRQRQLMRRQRQLMRRQEVQNWIKSTHVCKMKYWCTWCANCTLYHSCCRAGTLVSRFSER